MKSLSLITTLFLFAFLYCWSEGKVQDNSSGQFEMYVNSILIDTSNRWDEYPKPPHLTYEILSGLKQELNDDSANYFFKQLSPSNMKGHQVYTQSLSYFENHQLNYCMLVMMAHWNPDARTFASLSVNKRLKLRRGIIKNGKLILSPIDEVSSRFFFYLLERNPLFISGSENSTIHSYYISVIAWNLDVLSNTNFTEEKNIREWYKNDLNYESIVMKWKEHLNNK